jgi:tRNA modification GTPase
MEAEARGAGAAERVREGFEVALVGAPNVGKSTLLNALAGRDAALTSETAGTTRDVIEVRMDLAGIPVTLLDMAGLRDAAEQVEALGVARARERARQADVRVFLVETPADVGLLELAPASGDLFVRPKADLAAPWPGLAVSGLTGEGIDALLEALLAELGGRAAAAGNITRERQRTAVAAAAAALTRAVELAEGRPGAPELVSAEIRTAVRALDFLLGKVDVEAVLDAIFEKFCIGK